MGRVNQQAAQTLKAIYEGWVGQDESAYKHFVDGVREHDPALFESDWFAAVRAFKATDAGKIASEAAGKAHRGRENAYLRMRMLESSPNDAFRTLHSYMERYGGVAFGNSTVREMFGTVQGPVRPPFEPINRQQQAAADDGAVDAAVPPAVTQDTSRTEPVVEPVAEAVEPEVESPGAGGPDGAPPGGFVHRLMQSRAGQKVTKTVDDFRRVKSEWANDMVADPHAINEVMKRGAVHLGAGAAFTGAGVWAGKSGFNQVRQEGARNKLVGGLKLAFAAGSTAIGISNIGLGGFALSTALQAKKNANATIER